MEQQRILEQIKINGQKYSLWVPDEKLPEVKTRQELYSRLKIDSNFKKIQDMFSVTQSRVNSARNDKKYSNEYKKELEDVFYNDFSNFKNAQLEYMIGQLKAYRENEMMKNKIKQPDSLGVNNLLLQLQYIEGIGNESLVANFLQEHIEVDVIRNLVDMKYSQNNGEIHNVISNYEKELNEPYQLIDKEINVLGTMLQNADYIVNEDYIEQGITKFTEIRGETVGKEEEQQEQDQQQDQQDEQ